MKSRSYCHRGDPSPLLGLTIPEHLGRVARLHPEREAVVCLPQDRRLSYRELGSEIDRVARALLALGVGRGDRVAIWSTNNVEWLLLQMATARIGAILVNLNPAYRTRELSHALQRSHVQALFTIPSFRSSDYVAMLTRLLPELEHPAAAGLHNLNLPDLRHVVAYDPGNLEAPDAPQPGMIPWREFLAGGDGVSTEELDRATDELEVDDPINIQYTSGTTGLPKAVALTHHNILNNALFGAREMQFSETDRLCVPVPFYHCFGMVVSNLLCLSVGACLVIPCEHFEARSVLRALASERCTALHGVPTMFIDLLEQPDFRDFDLSSLRTGIMAGAPCPPALLERVMTDLHCPEILIGYGQTEASPLTHLTSRDDDPEIRTGTVGRNLPHQEVKIVHPETGATVAFGSVGEICFRGYHVMRGYHGDPEATARAIDGDGWLHSGDLGTMDERGYVRVTGRLKDMIIRGGENIYPREIEDFLFTHPAVAEVSVFGIPDERVGEEVVAWVLLHAGETTTEEELRSFCTGKIAHFKIPRLIRFVDEFPTTVTGKLQKFRMREIEATRE